MRHILALSVLCVLAACAVTEGDQAALDTENRPAGVTDSGLESLVAFRIAVIAFRKANNGAALQFCNKALALRPDFDHAKALKEGLLSNRLRNSHRDPVFREKVLEWGRETNKVLNELGMKTEIITKFYWDGSNWWVSAPRRDTERDTKQISGRVWWKSSVRGILVDVGVLKHDIRVGDILEVSRNYHIVGRIKIVKTDKSLSHAILLETTAGEDIRVGDHVQFIEVTHIPDTPSPPEKGKSRPKVSSAVEILAEADRLWPTDDEESIRLYNRLLTEFGQSATVQRHRNRITRRAEQKD